MCVRLSNKHHCLTSITVLSVIQLIWGSPIAALGLFIFISTTLGALLSPFWAGLVLMAAGFLGIFVRPTRSAVMIFIHMLLNVFALFACLFGSLVVGVYSISSQLPGYQQQVNGTVAVNGTAPCIFSSDLNLFEESIRNSLSPVEAVISDCTHLTSSFPFLIGLFALTVIGSFLSLVGLIIDICAPCIEERKSYSYSWDIRE